MIPAPHHCLKEDGSGPFFCPDYALDNVNKAKTPRKK
jgi:hypothetical protein